MALRDLHLLGSPVLRQMASEVPQVDDAVRTLVKDLFETMYAADGIGLAANQVGIAQRVAVVGVGKHDPIVLINPTIIEHAGSWKDEEGCLSLPDIFGDVTRAERIVLETTTLEGRRERFELSELPARAVLHEIDHLDGVLFLDHLSPLKRMMLLKKWKKLRKGQEGYTQKVIAARKSK